MDENIGKEVMGYKLSKLLGRVGLKNRRREVLARV